MVMTLISVRRSYKGRDEVDKDFELYSRFKGGEETALEELIGLYRNSLTNFINGFIHDENEAENLMIDVFVTLVRSKSKFRGESSLKTYLFAIGRNKTLRYIKRRQKFDFVPLEDVINFESQSPSPEDEVFRSLKNEEIHKAMGKLNPDYREILYLIYFEDMTYKQAGEVMRKSVKQVTNLAYRARQSLKRILEEGGVFDE